MIDYFSVLNYDRDMVKRSLPKPGTEQAINKGCLCPVLDNCHGQGYMGKENVFIVSEGCPLHDLSLTKKKKRRKRRKNAN